MIRDKKIINRCCALMKERFLEEEVTQLQLNGVSNSDELLSLQCKSTIETFNEIDCVEVIDNGAGFLIGYNTRDLTEEKLIQILTKTSQEIMGLVNADDVEIVQKNASILGEIAVFDWYKKYYNDGPIYYISVIAIDKSLKGTGAFRKLISPIIQKYENIMPIVLQTCNKENVSIYEHFGFRVIEERTSDKIDFICYNMMKWEE